MWKLSGQVAGEIACVKVRDAEEENKNPSPTSPGCACVSQLPWNSIPISYSIYFLYLTSGTNFLESSCCNLCVHLKTHTLQP